MSLQSKLNSLITSINEITGQSKTDLTSAIQDLADNQPSGSINITENGTYDVSQKASAIVNIPSFENDCTVPFELLQNDPVEDVEETLMEYASEMIGGEET